MSQLPELHDALQSLSVACQRRLILLDPNSAVMAYSIHEMREDRARLAFVMAHSDLWKISGRSRHQIRTRVFDEIGGIALVPIMNSDKHLLATLIYPLEDGSSQESLRALGSLAELEVIRDLLAAEESVAGTLNTLTSELVIDLVAGDENDAPQLAHELMDRKLIGVAELYTVVVLGPGRHQASHRDFQRVRLAVAQVLRFVNVRSTASIVGGILADGYGVLIFPRPVQKDQLNRLLEDPDLTPVRAGLGPMASLDQLHGPYLRARWALMASTKLSGLYPISVSWQDTGIDGYIASMPIDILRPEDLPAPLAAIITDRHVARWTGTLRVYLDSGGDIQATGQTLQIHRSTVYYRLDRMGEVSGVDLTDTAHHQALLFGLHLMGQYSIRFRNDRTQ